MTRLEFVNLCIKERSRDGRDVLEEMLARENARSLAVIADALEKLARNEREVDK